MDILHLVDRLEELFNESRSIPFTHSVILDEDRMLDIIDQMRVSIPDEIKKAQQLSSQRDRVLAQAQEEANRTIMLAREKGKQIIEQNEIVISAQKIADQIIEQAKLEAEDIKKDADDYSLETLTKLEIEMERVLNQIHNGIRALRLSEQPQPPDLED
jgi:vacuolar-type H+-ATPase subunit H